MKIAWNEEQKKVIETRNTDILVSAAAGSGKTAVLVERITRLICDEGVSFDELIVMTFTKAAAQEMRERVEHAMRDRLRADPGNKHIRTQLAAIARAKISTIDSVCQTLIKQYYQYLDIDPNFRVADEGELKIMRKDIIAELLEEKYKEADEAFMVLADSFVKKEDDSSIEELIMKLFYAADNKTSPERFLEELREEAVKEKDGDYEDSAWFKYFIKYVNEAMEDYLELFEAAKDICGEADGPAKYIKDIELREQLINKISGADTYETLYKAVSEAAFPKISTITAKDNTDPQKKAAVKKNILDSIKKFINQLNERVTVLTPELLKTVISESAAVNKTVTELTAEFLRRYKAAKREANIIDFGDMEHYAVELLYEERDGKLKFSSIADELSRQLKEIMIDEYQDSNGVQDAILKALSAERFGRPDIFMVGDVKQSIYRFRKADPKVFTEKYDSFTAAGEHIKIELNSNYRSRKEVVDSVNAVFDKIMRRELGGVEYDEAARLKAGAVYADNILINESGEAVSACRSEIMIADASTAEKEDDEKLLKFIVSGEDAGEDTDEDTKAKELEFIMIAERIGELVNKYEPEKSYKVQDKSGVLRPARYSDIAILMRNLKSNADMLAEVLEANNIPAVYDKKQGYFDTPELKLSIALLNIIDNPHQDIALAAVMRSPLFGFSDDELAYIRAAYEEHKQEQTEGVIEASAAAEAGAYAEAFGQLGFDFGIDEAAQPELGVETEKLTDKPETDLKEESRDDYLNAVRYAALNNDKARQFTKELDHFRSLAEVLPVNRLLERIFDESGYYNYVSAMPLGTVRRRNLDKLIVMAENYAGTGMRGLYNFIRYLEAMLEADIDDGGADNAEADTDSVRIVTIHGSKGLEYPIVFLAGCSEPDSDKDKSVIAADDELGIASDYTDLEVGIRYPSLKKTVIKLKNKEEDKGESLRLLYVAMTRAKEKLIITGNKNGTKKQSTEERIRETADYGNMIYAVSHKRGKLPKRMIREAKSYLELILLAAGNDAGNYKLSFFNRETLMGRKLAGLYKELEAYGRTSVIDARLEDGEPSKRSEYLTELFEKRYGHEAETKLKPKLSVSDIKYGSYENAEEAELDDGAETELGWERRLAENTGGSAASERRTARGNASWREEADETVKTEATLEKQIKSGGAGRGTIFHRAMELIDYSLDAEENLRCLSKCGKMSESELKLLDKKAVKAFFDTELADRMRKAFSENRLHREQHFMVGIPARKLIAKQDSDELQLLQGIIDAYIEECDGSITLIDYKTDRLKDEEEFKSRYAVQLELYASALTQLTGRPVTQKMIYSTFMNKQIML